MKKRQLILTVGLPRSGKSTWAKSTGHPIVNRDSIRLALHGQPYIAEAEDMVSAIEMYMVKALLLAGHEIVIVDATHLKDAQRERWLRGDWKVMFEYFVVPKGECIDRAIIDGREDLIPVIKRMAEESYPW